MPGQQGSSEQRGEDLFPCSQCVSWARHSAVMAPSTMSAIMNVWPNLLSNELSRAAFRQRPGRIRKGRSRGDSALRLRLSARAKSKILLDLNAQKHRADRARSKTGSGATYHPSQWREVRCGSEGRRTSRKRRHKLRGESRQCAQSRSPVRVIKTQ